MTQDIGFLSFGMSCYVRILKTSIRLSFGFFLFWVYSTAVAEGQIVAKGVIVYSPSSLGKDFAIGKIYTELEDYPQVLHFFELDGGKARAMKKNVFAILKLNSFTESLSSAAQLELVKQDIQALEKLEIDYRTTNPIVQELLKDANLRISRFNSGMQLIKGVWQKAPSMEEGTPSLGRTESDSSTNSIETKGGEILRDPQVSSVDNEWVTIRHSAGFAKVLISNLPEDFVKKWIPKTETSEMEASSNNNFRNGVSNVGTATYPPKFVDWTPADVDEASNCAVIIEGDRGSGSGFLCHVDNITYIYTNVHVLAGNRRIKIKDRTGKEFTEFSYVETASAGFDNGDIVRLALSEPVERALKLSPSGKTSEIGSKILVIGNSQGSGVLRVLEGAVQGVGPTRIEISADIVQGNSGGPILNEEFEVIGISSFGELRVDIWSKGTEFEKVRRFGLRPSGVARWDRFGGQEFLSIAFLYDQLVADIALVSVLDSINFSAEGLRYDPSADVIAGMNANEVVNSFKGHLFADALLKFNDTLSASGSTGDAGLDTRNLLVSYGNLISRGQIALNTGRSSMLSQRAVPFYVGKKIEEYDIVSSHVEQEKVLMKLAEKINFILN
ncbi:serine protease [Verrucomicrobiales bacterium]|nr:serine protease [Verrucomicrobiales bacterium]